MKINKKIKKRIFQIINIDLNIDFNKNSSNLFKNINNINIKLSCNNFFLKVSKGRKKWNNDYEDILKNIMHLFNDDPIIIKMFLQNFNFNQLQKNIRRLKKDDKFFTSKTDSSMSWKKIPQNSFNSIVNTVNSVKFTDFIEEEKQNYIEEKPIFLGELNYDFLDEWENI